MAEGRMAEIVGQRHRLGQILVEAEHAGDAARDLRHLDRMGQPCPVIVALMLDEDLRLVLEPPEGRGMDDPVTVALVVKPRGGLEGDYAFWGAPMVRSRTPKEDAPPIILIVCDTLRADALSCYESSRKTSPWLDAFAEEAVVFDHAVTPASWTLTAHASLFTGQYPVTHGVEMNRNLPESAATWPESMRDAGYATAGFTGHSHFLLPWRGFADGFDVYNVPHNEAIRAIHDTEPRVHDWLERQGDGPFFLFFHNYDIHALPGEPAYALPYGVPKADDFHHFSDPERLPPQLGSEPFHDLHGWDILDAHNLEEVELTEETIAFCRLLYDDAVRVVDERLELFFDRLRSEGLYDDALIVVTSDHGEAFNEHGLMGHHDMYEPCARVPLLIRFPQGQYAGARVADTVSLIDLMPTVLDWLGEPIPDGVEGQSLLPVIREGTAPHDFVYGQRKSYRVVWHETHKLVMNPVEGIRALYDWQADYLEQNNLAEAQPDRTETLLARLDAHSALETATGWYVGLSGQGYFATLSLGELTAAGKTEAVILARDGWRVGGDEANTVSGDQPFVRVGLSKPDGASELSWEEILRFHPFNVTLESSGPFTLLNREHPVAAQESVRYTAAPEMRAQEDGEGLWAHREARVIGVEVYYKGATEPDQAGGALTEEEREDLRSLGYL